ncbi:7130_t:CDS:1, partial [Dentiscutata erythropus]
TTHLHRHLKSCIKYKKALGSLNSNSKNTGGQIQLTFNQSTNWVYSQEKSKIDLVNMIIRDELSFQFSEHSEFLIFVKGLQPNFKV